MEMNDICLLPENEPEVRHAKVCGLLADSGIDMALIADNATIYYLTGRVFNGFVALYAGCPEKTQYFVRRPVGLEGKNVHYIRKPEDIPALLSNEISTVGLELDVQPYSVCTRLAALFEGKKVMNVSGAVRKARSVKTKHEQNLLQWSGIIHEIVYDNIPKLYREGMTDTEFQIEIERESRLRGCLGQFRICGASMELFMANILAGDNADNPTPYDFAMGGAGIDPSLPVGANDTVLQPGMSVMVDGNGNYSGYMTDLPRVFSIGKLSDLAYKAHDCSRAICRRIEEIARPGTEAKVLYEEAVRIADEA